MYSVSIYSFVALSVAALFGLIGTVQLAGPQFVRDAYRRWDYPQRLRLVTGALDIVAAVMLVLPSLRGWGIALCALLTFGSVVILLSHRQYLYALPALGLMLALIPATLAVPRVNHVQFIVRGHVPSEESQTLVASDDGSSAAVEQPQAGTN